MNLTKAQQLMVDDGFPPKLFLTTAERAAVWEANPPKPMGKFFDPREEQQKELRAQLKAEATRIRIAKLHAGQARKAANQVDRRGMQWDSRRCKWVPIDPRERKMKDDTNAAAGEATPVDATSPPVANTTETTMKKAKKTKAPAKKAAKGKATKAKAAKGKAAAPRGGRGEGGKSRVDVTLAKLRNWTSVEELAKAFKDELGDGKVSTATQAIHKVAVKHKKTVEKKKDEARGTLYRYV